MPAPRVDFQVRSQKAKAGISEIRRELRQLRNDATGTQRALSGLQVRQPRGGGTARAADDMSRLSREARQAAKALDRAGDEARSFDRRASGSRRQANGLVTEFLAFGSAVRALEGPLGGTAARLQTVGAVLKQGQLVAVAAAGAVAGLGFAFTLFARAAVNARLELNRIENSLRAATGSFGAARRELEFVREEADRLGLDLRTSAQQFGSLSAAARGSALAGDEVRRIFTAVGTAATALGLSTAEASGAFRAIQQVISKGNVQAEELRGQLGERLPGAFQIAARSLGVTTTQLNEMLERGEVLATDLLPKMATELLETFGPTAERAAQGLRAEINRFQTEIFESTVELDKVVGVSELWKNVLGATSSALRELVNELQGISEAQEQANKQTERAVELRQRQEDLAGTAAGRLAAQEQERLVQERFEAARERFREFLRSEAELAQIPQPEITERIMRGDFPRGDITEQRRFFEQRFPIDRAREFAREVISIAEAAQGVELFDPTQRAVVANVVDEVRRLRREGGDVQDVFARITGIVNRAVTAQARLGDETEQIVRNLSTFGRTATDLFKPEIPRGVERTILDARQAVGALSEEQRRARSIVSQFTDDNLADLAQALRNNQFEISRTGEGLRRDLIATFEDLLTVIESGNQGLFGFKDTLIEAGTGAASLSLKIGQQISNLREQIAAFEESAREGRIVSATQDILADNTDLSAEQARALATTLVDLRDRLADAKDETRILNFDLEKLRNQTVEAGTGLLTFDERAKTLTVDLENLRRTSIEAGTGFRTLDQLRREFTISDISDQFVEAGTGAETFASRAKSLTVDLENLNGQVVEAGSGLLTYAERARRAGIDTDSFARSVVEAGTGLVALDAATGELVEQSGGAESAVRRLRDATGELARLRSEGRESANRFRAFREAQRIVGDFAGELPELAQQLRDMDITIIRTGGSLRENLIATLRSVIFRADDARDRISNFRTELERLSDAAERVREQFDVTAGGVGFIGRRREVPPEVAEAMRQREQESERADEAVRESIRGLRDETTVLRLRVAGEARLADLTERRLALERQIGTELTPDQVEQLRREVGAQRALNRELEAQQELTRLVERGFDRIGGAITESFVKGEDAATSFRDVALGIISEIQQTILQFAAINPLKNMLVPGSPFPMFGDFGGNGVTSGGPDIISLAQSAFSIFGFGGPSPLQLSGPFSHGGSFRVGSQFPRIDAPGADNRLVTLTARDRERVTITPPGGQVPAPQVVVNAPVTIERLEGNVTRAEAAQIAETVSARVVRLTAPQIVNASLRMQSESEQRTV